MATATVAGEALGKAFKGTKGVEIVVHHELETVVGTGETTGAVTMTAVVATQFAVE